MKSIDLEKMSNIIGGKFLGSELSNPIDFDSTCASGLRANIYLDYYVLGIRVSHKQITTGPCVMEADIE